MAYTQSDLDALDRAIVSAELEVTVDGRSIRYRSMSELMLVRDRVASVLQQQAQAAAGGVQRSAHRFAFATSRGD